MQDKIILWGIMPLQKKLPRHIKSERNKYMARFAPVLPIPVAEVFHSRDALGTYHLLLAHDVLEYPDHYHDIYGEITSVRDDIFDLVGGVVIMDNSVIELGHPVTAGELLEAVNIVEANVIVLPDHLLDCDKTIRSTLDALETYAEPLRAAGAAMAVPQGTNFSEWVRCLEAFAEIEEIGWIGIPKNLNEKLGISRKRAVDAVWTICGMEKNCHMLGFSDDLWDDIMSTKYGDGIGIVKGIDSAAPIWSGWRDGHKISLASNIPGKRGDWFENPLSDGQNIERGINNANQVRDWLVDLG